jgi:hypothetical protein
MRRLPDLINDLAVFQGEDYEQTQLVMEGDWRTWTPFGSIGTDTVDKGGTFIGLLSFGTPEWDQPTNITTIPVKIAFAVTSILEETIYQGSASNKPLKVGNALKYEIELSKDGVTKKGGWAWIQVVGSVPNA